jgi:hypothetical protein
MRRQRRLEEPDEGLYVANVFPSTELTATAVGDSLPFWCATMPVRERVTVRYCRIVVTTAVASTTATTQLYRFSADSAPQLVPIEGTRATILTSATGAIESKLPRDVRLEPGELYFVGIMMNGAGVSLGALPGTGTQRRPFKGYATGGATVTSLPDEAVALNGAPVGASFTINYPAVVYYSDYSRKVL